MHGSRNFDSGKDRHLPKATQQVNERGEMRIICVLGFGVTETQFQLTSRVTWGILLRLLESQCPHL